MELTHLLNAVRILTVQTNSAVGLPSRILRHALVRPIIFTGYVPDEQPHVRFVRGLAHRILHMVFLALVDHVAVVPRPVVKRGGVSLSEALERHVVRKRGPYQLMRYPQHGWN